MTEYRPGLHPLPFPCSFRSNLALRRSLLLSRKTFETNPKLIPNYSVCISTNLYLLLEKKSNQQTNREQGKENKQTESNESHTKVNKQNDHTREIEWWHCRSDPEMRINAPLRSNCSLETTKHLNASRELVQRQTTTTHLIMFVFSVKSRKRKTEKKNQNREP